MTFGAVCSSNQVFQQNENAQVTSVWWRRMAVSERTWKSAHPIVLDLFVALLDPVPDPVDPDDFVQVGGRFGTVGLAGAAGAGQVGGQVPG
ncbi:hypothetical protein ACIGBH_40835 [Streptomyces sp. NPDC085929]|uniref:hypothetical protein n=1 Tax=Streptomyces sp. NPDC085929 TaxID=3365739 RepID=UPI0037D5342A